jgi:hypothetical protein
MPGTQIRTLKILSFLLLLPLPACVPQPAGEQQAPEQSAVVIEESTLAPAPVAEGTLTPLPTVSAMQTDTPNPDVPNPDPGMANVVGRILWNEIPVDGLGLLMCGEIDPVDGCLGDGYDSRTDENGVFRFLNVAPGEYDLVVESLDFSHWLYVTAGLESPGEKHLVAADTTLRLPDQPIYKFNLVTVSPGEDERIADPQPILAWEAYPDADYYLVFLNQENGPSILAGEKTQRTSIGPATDLVACGYAWQVEAYNASGSKIAEHDGFSHFQVVDQPLQC